MRLTELTGASAPGQGGVEIAGLAADSREVRPGFLFAALSGSKTDGGRFIDDALRNGAAAILAAPNAALEEMLAARGVPFVADANPRLRLARLAAAFFGAQPDTVAAVTGTNGKTSVATFTRQIWTSLGHRAASLGTLGVQGPGFEVTLAHTTPDPVLLHRLLAELAAAGVDHLAMEASSHGLDQYRLDGVRIRAAAFTNLTHDHLDYHADVEAYFAAKMRLFDAVLPEGGVAVVNADSDWYDAVRQRIASRGHRLIGYGVKAGDLRIERLTPHAHGIQLEATIFGTRQVIDLPLVGAFQAANALCALGLAIACGAEISPAVAALGRLTGVPGRMQSVATTPTGAPVFVDYAHTPDALQTVLTALRPHAIGRLAVVFGCGGDRDRTKRPLMGRIAANLADLVYVTDDNPRGEEPAAIRAAILATCPGAVEIGDRGEAIRTAIAGLHAGDVLVIAGKGHEQGQNVGGVVRPFDDASVARAAIATLPSSRQVH